MAKSTKYTEKVPKLEDYKAPFVTGEGEDREVDVDAAIKAVHTLMLDKAKAQDAREDAVAEVKEIGAARDELQAKVDDKNTPDAQVEIAKANKRAEDAEAKARASELRADRLEVAADKGLTPKQAKYLPKEGTKEELEAAADEILVDFPEVASAKGDEEEEGVEEETFGRQSPRPVNGSDPKLNKVEKEFDYEGFADKLHSGRL